MQIATFSLALALVAASFAQSAFSQQVTPSLAFEAASIKPSGANSGAGAVPNSPDRYTRANASFRDLVQDAFNVQRPQVVDIPSALAATSRFDVIAKAPVVPSPEQRRQMLQQLLADRFALRAHHETRSLPVYALRLGKDYGQPGKAFSRTKVNCDDLKAERSKPGESPAPAIDAQGRPICATLMRAMPSPAGITVRFIGNGVTPGEFTAVLSMYLDRLVVDETALTGDFDVGCLLIRARGSHVIDRAQSCTVDLHRSVGFGTQARGGKRTSRCARHRPRRTPYRKLVKLAHHASGEVSGRTNAAQRRPR